jgi:hypothetical protein
MERKFGREIAPRRFCDLLLFRCVKQVHANPISPSLGHYNGQNHATEA